MIKLDDLVTLAKAGWTPSQTKAVLEMLETSPAVKEAAPEQLVDVEKKEEPKEEPKVEPKEEVKPETNPLEELKKILSED
mgnify:CR=1 FL=1